MNPRSLGRFVRDLTLVLILTFALISLTIKFLAAPWVVRGASMSPTLRDGDRVIIDFWSYRRRAPLPGEVALIDGPGGHPMVKRVESGPIPRSEAPFLSPFRAAESAEDWFEVRGDNPEHSSDSRNFGPVPRNRFQGRILFRYWPLRRAGSIERSASTLDDAGR